MKKVKFTCLFIFLLPVLGLSQTLENLDYISPFHDGLAAVKKEGQWAFIDAKGILVIDFRDDLVPTSQENGKYPFFSDNRCLIKEIKQGIAYFGFIDTTGKVIIEPQFLNATNFKNGKAIALYLVKETVSRNIALGKDIVYYRYFEVTVDSNGNVSDYLTQKGKSIVLEKGYLRKPPRIKSKQISKNLYAIKDEQGKWKIVSTIK